MVRAPIVSRLGQAGARFQHGACRDRDWSLCRAAKVYHCQIPPARRPRNITASNNKLHPTNNGQLFAAYLYQHTHLQPDIFDRTELLEPAQFTSLFANADFSAPGSLRTNTMSDHEFGGESFFVLCSFACLISILALALDAVVSWTWCSLPLLPTWACVMQSPPSEVLLSIRASHALEIHPRPRLTLVTVFGCIIHIIVAVVPLLICFTSVYFLSSSPSSYFHHGSHHSTRQVLGADGVWSMFAVCLFVFYSVANSFLANDDLSLPKGTFRCDSCSDLSRRL